MADIFVSYARQDKVRVEPLVAALERQGWSVWWDPAINPGQEFDDRIAEEIDRASAVVVVWTAASVASRWVRGEAREAADRGILVPVRFDGAKLPIDARSLHTTDLDKWGGNCESAEFRELTRALQAHLAATRGRGDGLEAQGVDNAVSIAVLPFVNMSSDPDQEYFSDGLSEELINQLVKIKSLHVTGRTSSFAFKGRTDDLRLIGNKLGVNHVLEGSVRKAGNRLRITAQLIKCRDGFHLWSERYDRQLDDVFAIQDEVSAALAKALGITLGLHATPAPAATTNLQAYDKYLRAAMARGVVSPSELRRAVALLRDALALDPSFAAARAALIQTYWLLLVFAPETTADTVVEMAEAVRETLARVPEHWAGHFASGALSSYRYEWLGADSALSKAYALASSSETLPGSGYALLLTNLGRNSEAVRVLERVRAADPLDPLLSAQLQQQLDITGQPDAAQAEYERTKDLPGGGEVPEHQATIRLWPSGDLAAIRAQAQRLFSRQVVPMQVLAEVYEVFDRPSTALGLLQDAFDDPAYQDSTRLSILGLYAAHFGDPALALAAMRRAFIDKRGMAPHMIWFPVLSEARTTVGFKGLVRDMGLYDCWRISGRWGDFVRPSGSDDFEVMR